jgi:hypothetical protein
MRTTITVLLLCGFVPASHAADEHQSFAIRGAGIETCEAFLQQIADKSSSLFAVGGWLDGYVTGVNRYAPDTYDALSFETTDLVARLLENHCKAHPTDRLFAVVNALLAKLHDDRIRARSPLVNVDAGELHAVMYAEVLQRVQRKLTELGLYQGDPEPEFGDRTRAALTAFQDKHKLKATGVPDPVTLWQLLRQPGGESQNRPQ